MPQNKSISEILGSPQVSPPAEGIDLGQYDDTAYGHRQIEDAVKGVFAGDTFHQPSAEDTSMTLRSAQGPGVAALGELGPDRLSTTNISEILAGTQFRRGVGSTAVHAVMEAPQGQRIG